MKTSILLLAAVCGGLFAVPLLGQPVITKQPTNQTVSIGATVRFRVSVDSPGADWTVQWWFKDAPLDAGVNPSVKSTQLSLTNVTMAAAGEYWAVGTADGVSVASDKVTLDVDPTFVVQSDPGITAGVPDMIGPYWVDLDGDGWLELVVTGGYNLADGTPLVVFDNNRDGTLRRNRDHDLAKLSGRFAYIA